MGEVFCNPSILIPETFLQFLGSVHTKESMSKQYKTKIQNVRFIAASENSAKYLRRRKNRRFHFGFYKVLWQVNAHYHLVSRNVKSERGVVP